MAINFRNFGFKDIMLSDYLEKIVRIRMKYIRLLSLFKESLSGLIPASVRLQGVQL